ncbi:hypothetical protein [Haloarcula argentinensis]|uniref:Uncharacterized protein n=1 Tax=Haloarcula argentinensis TaxID=43776 RepID=A0ABU2F7P7_HALAR|nr:hypothetical protein [Haloarcula argentinensis]MDS0256075.1 hypothetical protein [Haloarcula argentinensis]
MTDRHIAVSSWDDIDAAPEASPRAKQRVATIITEQSWDHVVWLPSWLLEDSDKDIETVEASDHLAVGGVEDYSDDAWQFAQTHRNVLPEFLPKSSVVVFERARGVEEISTPQTGLTAFAGDADD